jgi:hypothetical protein
MTIVIPLKGGSLSKTYRLPQYNTVCKEVSTIKEREYGFMRWYSQTKKMQRLSELHPDLFPKIYEISSNDEHAEVKMEWLDGYRDIKSILTEDILSETQIIEINNAVWKALNAIHSRTYNFIDNISNGNKQVYGFIAQDTSNIIPECVSLQEQFIPNIYTNAIINGNIITFVDLDKDTSCINIENKKIKLITHDTELIVTLDTIIDAQSFKIKETIDEDEYIHAFVYGQYIEDFYVLEKDTIFTLTTSAVKALDIENQELKKKVNTQENKINNLEMRLAALEAKFNF